MNEREFTASEVRALMQRLFPHRRLVLSQFTFFNQVGVAKPTGSSFQRGRQCYRLEDLLSIATVVALKEEGIPLKNISSVPQMVQAASEAIFKMGEGCNLYGYKDALQLLLKGDGGSNQAIEAFLADSHEVIGESPAATKLLWSYDVGSLAMQLRRAAEGIVLDEQSTQRRAA